MFTAQLRTGSLYIIQVMCFVWIWEQTAIISLYSINWLVFITETECVYCAVLTGSLYIIQVMCFAWIWEQTAIISLYGINWLVLGAFAKLRKANISYITRVRPFFRPHGVMWITLDGLSWHLIFEYFSKICRGNYVSLNLTRIGGIFHGDRCTSIYDNI